MHHYRCQNVYISATACERIMDTIEFFPHNYQMPQLSSTDRLVMAAKDMTDALQNPHPRVPFASVGDDTISSLADLATIFKLKLRQTPSPAPQAVPPQVFQHPSFAESSNQILNSPMPITRQTRSQMTIPTQDFPNVPLPPRVVTPRTLLPSPLRVPTRSRRLSPRNLSQDDFCRMDTAHMAIPLGDNNWSQKHKANAVIHPVTGKEMEYSALMKDPVYNHFGHEDLATNADASSKAFETFQEPIHFLHQTDKHPKRQKDHLRQIVCDYKPHKKEKEHVRLTVGGDKLNYSGDIATSTADITTFKISTAPSPPRTPP
jgi:hypothetical protein